MLVYGASSLRFGDWYGGVNADNAAAFLNALLGVNAESEGGARDPVLTKYWRGRMGLTTKEQVRFWCEGQIIFVVHSDPSCFSVLQVDLHRGKHLRAAQPSPTT